MLQVIVPPAWMRCSLGGGLRQPALSPPSWSTLSLFFAGYSTDGTDKGDLPMMPNDLGEWIVP